MTWRQRCQEWANNRLSSRSSRWPSEWTRPLRSLDAIHLASALLLEADVVLTYDKRLAAACIEGGLAVAAPGSDRSVPAVPHSAD